MASSASLPRPLQQLSKLSWRCYATTFGVPVAAPPLQARPFRLVFPARLPPLSPQRLALTVLFRHSFHDHSSTFLQILCNLPPSSGEAAPSVQSRYTRLSVSVPARPITPASATLSAAQPLRKVGAFVIR